MVSGRPSNASKPSGKCKIDRGHEPGKRREKRQTEQLGQTGKRTRRYVAYDHSDPLSPVNILRDTYLADQSLSIQRLSNESEERVGVHVPHGAIFRAVKNQNLGKPGRPPELSEDEEREIVQVSFVISKN